MEYKLHVQPTASCGVRFCAAKLPESITAEGGATRAVLLAWDLSGHPLEASFRPSTRLCVSAAGHLV